MTGMEVVEKEGEYEGRVGIVIWEKIIKTSRSFLTKLFIIVISLFFVLTFAGVTSRIHGNFQKVYDVC